MEKNTTNFKNFIYLKDQLMCLTSKELQESYQDIDNYTAFIYATVDLINNEASFYLLDSEYIEKTQDVIGINRFHEEIKDLRNTINDIIVCLNGIKSIKDPIRTEVLCEYIVEQEVARRVIFKERDAILHALSYDSSVLAALDGEEDLDTLTIDPYTLMSINYLSLKCPLLFEDKKIKSNAVKTLDNISARHMIFKRSIRGYSNELKDNIQKVKKQEE